jgi:hypothetical protein
MRNNNPYRWRGQMLWGLLLVVLGVGLLLDQLGMFDIETLWHYWPLLLVVVGINRMIGFPSARDFTGGLWMTGVGLWLFAIFDGGYGLTFYNSWPVFIIISGVAMVLEPVVARRLQSRESDNEKP